MTQVGSPLAPRALITSNVGDSVKAMNRLIPHIKPSSQYEDKVNTIIEIIESTRKNPKYEAFDNTILRAKLTDIIAKKEALRFVLPIFHGKCSSRKFTIANSPDCAEYLAVETLGELHGLIADVYPNTRIYLISEGHLHTDVDHLIGNEADIEYYTETITTMLQKYPGLVFCDAIDMLDGTTREQQRNKLLNDYSPNEGALRSRMRSEVYLTELYRAYIKLHLALINDQPLKSTSRSQLRSKAKQRAMLQLRKYVGFAKLIEEAFGPSSYVKLSPLYKSPTQHEQIGINVIKGIHTLGTITFHSICKTHAGILLLTAEEARQAGYHLVEDRFPYFLEEGQEPWA